MTVIKSELITRIAQGQSHIPEKDVASCVNLLLEQMTDTLCAKGRIEIRGFGSFCLHYRPPRNAHNPKTGERVITVAKYTPYFKPGKGMRERINESRSHVEIIKMHDRDDDDDGGSATNDTSSSSFY